MGLRGLHVPAARDVELDHQPLLRRAGNLGISVSLLFIGADSSHVSPFGQHLQTDFAGLRNFSVIFLVACLIICYEIYKKYNKFWIYSMSSTACAPEGSQIRITQNRWTRSKI